MAVPADREAERSDELRDVFEEIDAIAAEAAGIGEEATKSADRVVSEAEAEADRILAAAHSGAAQARAEAASHGRRAVDDEITSTTDEAHAQAACVRERAERNLDAVAARLVQRVLDHEKPVGADRPTGGEGSAA